MRPKTGMHEMDGNDPDRRVSPRSLSLNGVAFMIETLEGTAAHILENAQAGRSLGPVRLVNTHTLANAGQDQDYARLLSADGLNVPDGTPLRWALSRRAHIPIPPLRGPDLFREVLKQ